MSLFVFEMQTTLDPEAGGVEAVFTLNFAGVVLPIAVYGGV